MYMKKGEKTTIRKWAGLQKRTHTYAYLLVLVKEQHKVSPVLKQMESGKLLQV